MNRSSLLTGSAIVASAICISMTACAQDAREFNIPAGDLGDALNAFAGQSDQQIFFTADLVTNVRTAGLHGRHLPTAALDRLLDGTSLSWTEARPGVFYIRRARVSSAVEAIAVEDVVVTGTLLKTSGNPASPVIVLSRDDLDRRGYGTVAETLAALPQNYATSTPLSQAAMSDVSTSNNVFATGVNLRGLGAASTLVLVNGHRLAGTGARAEFSDISALPSAAVERVDVLLDGASALYGSDAVAGVVNVIMRRSFAGQESRFRVSAAQGGGDDVQISHLAGLSWTSGSGYLSYEYQNANGLGSKDRDYTADGDLRRFGGTDHRGLYSVPGNIVAFDPVRAAYVTQFGIRPNASGRAQTAGDFVAGQSNLLSPLAGVDLLPALERHSVYGRLRQDVGDRVELTADLRYSHRANAIASPATTSIFTVTSANPGFVSPTGAASHLIAYSFLEDMGPARSFARSESLGLTVGAKFDLTADWTIEAYLADASEKARYGLSNRVNSTFLAEALGNTPDNPATAYSAARDGYFNPFGAGAANTREVLDFIGAGYSEVNNRSGARSANLLVQGAILSLPAGQVSVAFGVQVREETYDNRGEVFLAGLTPRLIPSPRRERGVSAVFAEARIPLVGSDNARPGVRSLDLSVAGRVEDYDDFGTTTNPKVGVIWSPMEAVSVRASWGTSFRAGALQQIYEQAGVSPAFLNRANGLQALALLLIGGNPDLKPETSETFTAGFDYRPRRGPSISVNLFETRFEDRIAQPVNANFDGALIDPTLSSFVTFIDPATRPADLALVQGYATFPGFSTAFPATAYGAIVDTRWVNTGAVRVRGLDLTARQSWPFGGGEIAIDTAASWVLDYDNQTTPTAPTQTVVGLLGYPAKIRARTGLTWTRDALQFGAAWNFSDRYRDAAGRRIDAWNTIDGQISWSPSSESLRGLRIQLTAQNLLDEDPPFYNASTGYGFDANQASPLGRVVSLQLIQRW